MKAVNMRGIELIIHEKSDFVYDVLSLLNPIGVKNYVWHVAQECFIIQNKSGEELIPDILCGSELSNIIQKKELILYLNLRAFPLGSKITEPESYSEYISSDCHLVFLCFDCYYVEIYCKDSKYIDNVYTICKSNPDIEKVGYKTEENDGRYMLYV